MSSRTARHAARAADERDFLPMTRAHMDALGWKELDILLVTGDAYVDHPSFGVPLLGRWLAAQGFRVGICAQPRWDTDADVTAMGRPRLFAGAAAGALDSQLAHYTAFRKKRHDDAYTPGGKAGARPNRAVTVYANLLRRAFPGLPVVLGGIEASLRRASHYDFWTDKLRRSVLLDAKADAVVYGMGERAMLAIARSLRDWDGEGTAALQLAGIPGIVTALRPEQARDIAGTGGGEPVDLPSHEDILADPRKLMNATLALEKQVHQGVSFAIQPSGDRAILFAPPSEPLSTQELDALYDLPFTRLPHPSYTQPIPAWDMIKGSMTSHRGCAGGCSFCALALHQGRRVRSRSRASLLREAKRLAGKPWFDGSISDVGGPSGNMWNARCTGPDDCARDSCLTPSICRHFQVNQREAVELLRAVRAVPGVKHVRMASGLRLDLALADEKALRDYVAEFTGGQLKVAPEHGSDKVLKLMRKPSFDSFERLCALFDRESRRAGKRQYIVPYLMSAFPGCEEQDMKKLGDWLAGRGWHPKQVQCFIPLPGTVAAAMFYAGVDTKGRDIAVARTDAQRLAQHRVLIPTAGTGARPGNRPKQPARRKGPGKNAAPGDREDGAPATKKRRPGPKGRKRRSADQPETPTRGRKNDPDWG